MAGLYNQWGSYPEFQRTRGVLRFLALVVRRAWQKRLPVPLIRPSDVPLEDEELRAFLSNCIGPAYKSVIACDIAGGREHARHLNNQMPEELRSLRLPEGLATAIFLHSFSGAHRPDQGATGAWPGLSVPTPEVPLAAVGDALYRLEETLHYLHKRENRYYFSTRLNLARAVAEAWGSVSQKQITEEIRKAVEKRVERVSPFAAHVLWPGRAEEVSDRRDGHVLVVLSPDLPFGKEKTPAVVRTLFARAGSGFRAFPGALLVLAPDSEELFSLKEKVRRLLALVSEKRRYREIWEMFLRTPQMPIVPKRAVREDLRKAVSQGLVSLVHDGKPFFKTDVPDAYLDEGYVLPPALLPPPSPPPSPAAPPSPPPSPRPARTTYRLKTKVPWERFSDVFRGVIQPLTAKAEQLELVIELRAKSSAGIPAELLESKVRETLRQINAQILKEQEE